MSLFSRKPTEVLAIHESGDALVLAVVGEEGVRGRVEASSSGDLARDLPEFLAAARSQGLRLPSRAILLTEAATALCIEVPPLLDAPRERIEGLVRFELDPLLHEAGPAGVACGWAACGEQSQGGPLLTCGLGAAQRDALAGACRRAGLTLEAIYAPLSCGPVLASAAQAGNVVELGPRDVSVARLERGRVTRLRRIQPQNDQTALGVALRELSPSEPLTVVGPVEERDLVLLRELVDEVQHVPSDAPASLLGAARHFLGQAGCERAAGVPAQAPPQPLSERLPLRALAALALLLALVAGADVYLHRRAKALRERLAVAERAAQEEDRRQRLLKQRADLDKALEPLRESARRSLNREARAREIDALLGVLASAPAGLALDLCEDRGDELLIEGEAQTPAQAENFLHRLNLALAGRALELADRQLERDAQGLEVFRFKAAFRLREDAAKGAVK